MAAIAQESRKDMSPCKIKVPIGAYEEELLRNLVQDAVSPLISSGAEAEVPLVTWLGYYSQGASNCNGRIVVDSIVWSHMVSDKALLTDFQLYATPRMARLRNGTNFPITGVGKLETECFDIPCVEFAPGLKMNCVSLNQLDRDHGLIRSFGSKEFEIRKDDGTVVGAGVLDDGGIYVLKNLQVPKPEM